jgi:hypothetical protein
MGLVKGLYKAARIANTVNAAGRGRLPKRLKNIILGRVLNKLGFWRIWR